MTMPSCSVLFLLSLPLLVTFLTLPPLSSSLLGASHVDYPFNALSPSARTNEGNYEREFLSDAEAPIAEPFDGFIDSNSQPELVLAPVRTYRNDPLNGFKRYTGGWNFSDQHYWASVGFTAAPLFAVALIWFVGFGFCLLLICLCRFCFKSQNYGYSRTAYVCSLVFLIIFSIIAMIGCVVLYTGQDKLHRTTKETLDYVVNQADSTADQLRTISDYLASAKLVGVDQVFVPSNVQTDIDQIETRINSSASFIVAQTTDSAGDIQDLLDSVRLALIVVSAIMLLLTLLGFLFSIFGMQFLVYILVVLGWIIVAGTFILCGTFLILHNVAADTCVAMEQWVENPTAHTALDEILPCVDNATTQETLIKSKEVVANQVEVVNQVITNVSNINFSPNFPVYINQSGPLVPVLCNPFHWDLTDRTCSPGEVDLNNATQVWSNYECQVTTTGKCTTTGRLTPEFYNQMAAAVNVSYALYHYSPFLVELQDCTYVRATFNSIHTNNCPDLQSYTKWIYIGLVMVSTAVMLSLMFWIIYGRERRHRVYTKQQLQDGDAISVDQGLEGDKHSQEN